MIFFASTPRGVFCETCSRNMSSSSQWPINFGRRIFGAVSPSLRPKSDKYNLMNYLPTAPGGPYQMCPEVAGLAWYFRDRIFCFRGFLVHYFGHWVCATRAYHVISSFEGAIRRVYTGEFNQQYDAWWKTWLWSRNLLGGISHDQPLFGFHEWLPPAWSHFITVLQFDFPNIMFNFGHLCPGR